MTVELENSNRYEPKYIPFLSLVLSKSLNPCKLNEKVERWILAGCEKEGGQTHMFSSFPVLPNDIFLRVIIDINLFLS